MLAGYPTVNVIATLVDGQYHDVDSSEMAFKIAGQMAFKKAAEMAKPVLLEPIMGVEVVTPDEYMGDVMGDLSSRRGRIEGMEARGNTQVVRAQVPLSEMFGYSHRPALAHAGSRHLHDAVRLATRKCRTPSPPTSSSAFAANRPPIPTRHVAASFQRS